MDKLKYVKLELPDGSYSESIPLAVDVENIEMEDGESVETKINKKPYYYNSVADMKADTKLKVGDMVITLGYYEANDGGAADYRIVNGDHIDDGGSYHRLNNNLFAELIISHEVNIRQFGAKADLNFDSASMIQNAIYTAFNNQASVFIPGGNYLVTKPLILLSSKNELADSFYIKGENIENTYLRFNNIQPLSNLANFDVKCGFMLLNETYLDSNKNIINGSGSTGRIVISDMYLQTNDNSADVGIYCPITTFSCSFERMRIRGFNEAGIRNKTNYYLNRHEQIRVDSSQYSFDAKEGICTSLLYDSCYSVGASEVAYRISSVYSEISNCCADGCSGICFDLTGFAGTVVSPGTESPTALYNFKGGSYTNVTIVNAHTQGNFTNAEAYHIWANAGASMIFIGGSIMRDDVQGTRNIPGGLLKSGTETNVQLNNVHIGRPYAKSDPYNDVTVYQEWKTKHGRVMTRNGHKIAFLGFDGGLGYGDPSRAAYNANEAAGYIDKDTAEPEILANAIYFGFGTNPSYLDNGLDARWLRPNLIGDIVLSKKPKQIGGMGWIQASEETDRPYWSRGDYLKIPVILSGSSEERPLNSNMVVGQMYFDTTLGKPIWYKGSNKWVDASGTEV